MKKLLYLFPFLFCYYLNAHLSSIYNADDWVKISNIYISRNTPLQDRLIWLCTDLSTQRLVPEECDKEIPTDYPHDQWITVSVVDKVSKDAKAIYLEGILKVFSGTSEEYPQMFIQFRRKGDNRESTYIHQIYLKEFPGTAQISLSAWVLLNEKKEFEFKWSRNTFGSWPKHPAYIATLHLSTWGE
ncbi:MAG TPA: hypothetical protein VGK47_14785 [Nitrososphaeraceae archaeon]